MDWPPEDEGKWVWIQRDRMIQEQFISGINNNDMMTEIIKELTTIGKTNWVTSDQVLSWTKDSR